MRFYDLTISVPDSGEVYKPSLTSDKFTRTAGGTTFTSYVSGQTVPGALNIEFDFPVVPFNSPQGVAHIRVWGVGLGMIGQAADLNGMDIKLSAGMKHGLPLADANPKKSGPILQGTIFQAYGNWQGVNQTLELICYPQAAEPEQDIMLDWKANTPLSQALSTTFAQAFPDMDTDINIAEIIRSSDDPGHYTTLSTFSKHIFDASLKLGQAAYGDKYSGVSIVIVGNTLRAFDSQAPQEVNQLLFNDFIGQPTWINPATVSFKTVLRSDIAIGDLVKFPQKGILAPFTLTSVSAATPNAPSRSQLAFKSNFVINEVHHFANFRQADADSWTTAFTAAATDQ